VASDKTTAAASSTQPLRGFFHGRENPCKFFARCWRLLVPSTVLRRGRNRDRLRLELVDRRMEGMDFGPIGAEFAVRSFGRASSWAHFTALTQRKPM